MSDDSRTTYRFDGDASGLLTELKAVRAALDTSAQQAVKTGAAIDNAAKGSAASLSQASTAGKAVSQAQTDATNSVAKTTAAMKAHGAEAKGAAAAVHSFSFETAASKRELLVLAHELSQGNFKRFGGSLLVLAEQTGAASVLFSATGLAVLGLTAAVGGVALAYYKAYEDQQAFNRSLILTNNAAGLTNSTFKELAQSIAAANGHNVSSSQSRDALQATVSTGRFGPESVAPVASAVATISKLTGVAADEVVKDFEKMADAPTKYSLELNKQYHYLSLAQLEHIRQLESEGRAQDAAAISAGLLDTQLNKNRRTLDGLPGLLHTAAIGWDAFWQSARGLLTPDTTADKLDIERKNLESLLQIRNEGTPAQPVDSRPAAETTRLDAAITAQRAKIGVLQDLYDKENDGAKKQAAEDQKNQKDIEDHSAEHVKALHTVEIAAFNQRAQQAAVARAQMQVDIDKSYDKGVLTLGGYEKLKYSIEKAAINDRMTLLKLEADANARSVVGTPNEKLAREAKQIDIDTKRIALQKDLIALDEKRRLLQLGPKKIETFDAPTGAQDFSRFERAQQASVEKGIEGRRTAALAGDHDLLKQNELLSASLIKDTEERERAQLDIEANAYRQKLDFAALNVDDRKKAEQDFADWYALKEKAITENVKPEWQKRLELWQDTTRHMKESLDGFLTGWQDVGQSARTEFLKTGKVNISAVTNFAIEEFAKVSFQKTLGAAWTDLGKTVSGWLGFGTGVKSGGAADALGGQAAQTAAVDASTVSLQGFIASLDAAIASLNGLAGSGSAAGASNAGSGSGGWLSAIGNVVGAWFGGGLNVDTSGVGTNTTGGQLPTAGGRAEGGPTQRGKLYEVNEKGDPELISVGRKTYLMMGANDGMVTPASRNTAGRAAEASSSAGRGGDVILNVTHNGQDKPKVTQSSRQTSQGTVIDLMIDTLVNDINSGGRTHDALQRRYGLNSAGSAPRF